MKIRYHKEIDAAYIQMPSKKPDGAVENEIAAIEIIDAAKKFPIRTLYKLEVASAGA